MPVLFDQGVPVPLRKYLVGHVVVTASEQGWGRLANGALLSAAEADGFEVFVTNDKNLSHQQNLSTRQIAIVVLGNSRWPWVELRAFAIGGAVAAAGPGTYVVVDVPPP